MPDDLHGSATQIGPAMVPKLKVTRGPNPGETYKLKLTTTIGRERDNDIILLDPKISRHHAQITAQKGEWIITDLGSANKTYLNGSAVTKPAPLKSGDRLSFGEFELTFSLPGDLVTDDAALPRRGTGDTITTPLAPTPAATEPVPEQTPATAPTAPRITWIAGGFIALLAIVAVAVFLYAILGRPTATEDAPPTAATGGAGAADTTAEPAASPSTELVLAYEDDFSDSFGGWDDAFDTYTTKQYGNNRYQIEVTASNLVAWGLANRDVADFEIEVETRREDGGDINSYGILFRFQDRENFYRFDISGDGYFLLSKFIAGQWETLIDWQEAPSLNTDLGANNILKVSAIGSKITVWANGQALATITDDDLSHGNFGFFASTFSEPYLWVSYDNLKLWVPDGQEQAITLIPTPTIARIPTATTSPVPPTATPTELPEPTEPATEAPAQPTSPLPTPTPTEPPAPTATPVPLPEYASRDQTLARGEERVTGRIVFPLFDPERGTYDIYIANAADGSDLTLLQEDASQPALTLDGSQLAYRSWQADKRGLFARPMAGGDAWGFDLFFESARPQFSPADESLMYHSRTGGDEPAIYRVIDGVGQVMRRDGAPIRGSTPKWSANGQQFVYRGCLGNNCGIILSNIDGTNPTLLSDHPSDTTPEISPDGDSVVFMSERGGDWEIYKVEIADKNITALTSDDANDGLPTFSPNGSKIAFVANRDSEWAVWDMDPDGSNQRRLFDLNSTIDGIVQHDINNSLGWTEENIDWIP